MVLVYSVTSTTSTMQRQFPKLFSGAVQARCLVRPFGSPLLPMHHRSIFSIIDRYDPIPIPHRLPLETSPYAMLHNLVANYRAATEPYSKDMAGKDFRGSKLNAETFKEIQAGRLDAMELPRLVDPWEQIMR